MKLPHPRHGNTIADMAKDERQRNALTIDLNPEPSLRGDLEKEAAELSKKLGVNLTLGAYVRMLLKTHQDRLKKKKK